MKSTVFELKYPHPASNWMGAPKETDVMFPIPTLKAYAIEYSEFTLKGGFNEHKEMIERQDYDLVEDGLIWHTSFAPMHPRMNYYRLVIHYHGIKDYALLFPHVQNRALQQRLGRFYKESEVSFDNGAWLALALMCGAIYEGMLFDHGGGKERTFSELIDSGKRESVLDEFSEGIINRTRELRNLVHPGLAEKPYVTRAEAMDMRTVLDRLIKQAAGW